MTYPKLDYTKVRIRDNNSLVQKVDPRLDIRDSVLDRRQQELSDICPKDRREPNDILPPRSPSITRRVTTDPTHPSNSKRAQEFVPDLVKSVIDLHE